MNSVRFDPKISRLREIEKLVTGLIEDTESSVIALHPESISQINAVHSPDMRSVGLLIQKWRERREEMFPVTKYGEAGWDILLGLHIEFQEGRLLVPTKVAISRACVPPTTGLRWLSVLEESGFVRRISAAHDQRLKLVELDPLTYDKIDEYLRGFRDAMSSLFSGKPHSTESNIAYFTPPLTIHPPLHRQRKV